MRARVVVAVIGVALVCVLLPTGALAKRTGKVTVGNNFYDPERVVISRGDKLKFRWQGGIPHNVTLRRGPGRPFASETTMEAGVNFRHTFEKSGRYLLHCTIHPDQMQLTVRVR